MTRHLTGAPIALLTVILISGCGAKSALLDDIPDADRPDSGPPPDARPDARPDAQPDAQPDAEPDATVDADVDSGCIPVEDGCGATERCGDGDDDDCDGSVDEGCACEPGEVQPCFMGPPGRRDVGACRDGAQTCELDGTWGLCEGGIWPTTDICNGLDNQCNGCSELEDCEIECPGPDDPRVAVGAPLEDYLLSGHIFYAGLVRSWRWQVEGGPCDRIATRFQSFELRNDRSETATFHPLLSGDYRVTLTVVTEAGTRLSCEWLVHVAGPGLRIEMCYPESEFEDLDLFLKQPGMETPWYVGEDAFQPAPDQCGWHNCEAYIRGSGPRADWGYDDSDLSECIGGPLGDRWAELGSCANPRLDIDNNLSEGTGLPENINVDAPRDGDAFRIMVQNFSGGTSEPLINVYCSGRRVATIGSPPDVVPSFNGPYSDSVIGAMWRAADVTTHVDAAGGLTCDVSIIHPPDDPDGYDTTVGNPQY